MQKPDTVSVCRAIGSGWGGRGRGSGEQDVYACWVGRGGGGGVEEGGVRKGVQLQWLLEALGSTCLFHTL